MTAEIRVTVSGNLVGGAGFQGRYDHPAAEYPSVSVFVIMPCGRAPVPCPSVA